MSQTEKLSDVSTRIKLSLGPFVGDITESSVKIWINVEAEDHDKTVYVTLKRVEKAPSLAREYKSKDDIKPVSDRGPKPAGVITCTRENLGTGVVTIANLQPNSRYEYELWEDADHSVRLDLNPVAKSTAEPTFLRRMRSRAKSDVTLKESDRLQPDDLFFWTLPEDGYGRQLDFLLMSCHHPDTKKTDGFDGFGVWHHIPKIIDVKQNGNVRFAILAGDQVYADEVEAKLLNETDPHKRRALYLDIYRKFWGNIGYRKVLCRLPAVLMWDDHDITDGWGSREDSFVDGKSTEFKPEWKGLFDTGRDMFALMQASRNPEPVSKDFKNGFDTCFKVGGAGFVLADLRSNRNVRRKEVWKPDQLAGIKSWIQANKEGMHTLFFVSSVVFSHGAPKIETWILRKWFRVLDFAKFSARLKFLKGAVKWFDSKFGDLRDDINDSWGAEVNAKEADRVLDFLFELENPPNEKDSLNVIILSGDIHTPGYSTIYSSQENLKKAVIPHIVATPVSYEPFSWVGEAVFRHLTKVVALGEQGRYTSQVSHHFCYRNVVVISLRNYEADESNLKVKYYLEGFPEPQVMLFDLIHGAKREDIKWEEPPEKEPGGLSKFWQRLRGKKSTAGRLPMPAASPSMDLPESPPVEAPP